MAKKFKGGMHGRDVIYNFKNPAMDFFFQWVLGMSTNGGSTVGECFSTASKIKEGDTESWVKNWDKLGADVQKRAETSLKNKHYERHYRLSISSYCRIRQNGFRT